MPLPLGNVTTNGLAEKALRVSINTLIGSNVAPAGTIAVIEFVEAAVTTAFTAPKYTLLLAGVALKLLPAITTELPIAPADGEKELITGICPKILRVNKLRL